ncbi:MAG: hypothetical protein IJ831_01135 [Spirochaetales bacterium]|nr:hypothetical protein [Spirochaetales bacterium]
MNKKVNTLIYMLVATLINLLLMAVLYIAAFIAYALFISYSGIDPESPVLILLALVCFIVPVVLAFIIYSKIAGWAINRFNLEDKMGSLFTFGRRRRNRED